MDHGGHGGHEMPARCAMHMLWNTQIINTCVVFRQWHITSNTTFFFSLLAIAALGVFYEYLRKVQRTVDIRIAQSIATAARLKPGRPRSPSPSIPVGIEGYSDENEGLLASHRNQDRNARRHAVYAVPHVHRALRALLYASTVFLSFFLMLVFMTYNAYLILAVVAGAGVGHYIFSGHMDADAVLGNSNDSKGMACH